VDIAQMLAGVLVERLSTHLLEEFADHDRDPQELGRLLDGALAVGSVRSSVGRDGALRDGQHRLGACGRRLFRGHEHGF
jgi:hypothetical protein